MAATACERAAAAAVGFIPAEGLNVVVVVEAGDVIEAVEEEAMIVYWLKQNYVESLVGMRTRLYSTPANIRPLYTSLRRHLGQTQQT